MTEQCQYCGRDCKNLAVHLRFCKLKPNEEIEETKVPEVEKIMNKEIPEIKKPEPEPIMNTIPTSISVVVGDVTLAIIAPSTVQSVTDAIIDILKNIAELRNNYNVEDEETPKTQPDIQIDKDVDTGIDLENQKEYERLMEKAPAPPEKKGSVLMGLLRK